MHLTNQDRIEAARAALMAHQNATKNYGSDTEEATIDLLNDLCYLANLEGIEMLHVLGLSVMHFRDEHVESTRPHRRRVVHETWLVQLCIRQNETLFAYWIEQAAEQLRQAPTRPQVLADRPITVAQAARYHLAEQLQREVADGSGIERHSIDEALLRASLWKVDWFIIAEDLLEKVQMQR